MNEILNQLGQLFVQTIPTVIFVFALVIILERILFNPVKRILAEREEATSGALAKAREQIAAAAVKAREYEAALMAARQNIYQQKEQARRSSLEERGKSLQAARQKAEAFIKEASTSISRETALAQEELRVACHSLAQEITEVIVGGSGGKILGGGPAA
ncbi:MAG TPA: ATP synthase F0 subunit B [Terriglobia bacterium]|nr:ATP synthase F0 subunit B [Terriglobia bacterium]